MEHPIVSFKPSSQLPHFCKKKIAWDKHKLVLSVNDEWKHLTTWTLDFVSSRYQTLIYRKERITCWTLQENEILLEHFFSGKGTASFEIVQKLSANDFATLTAQLYRYFHLTFAIIFEVMWTLNLSASWWFFTVQAITAMKEINFFSAGYKSGLNLQDI